jgi:hypothetical protein
MKWSAFTWRWRRSPLRRRSYAVQAWAVLAAGLITAAGAVLAGAVAYSAARHDFAEQRLHRHVTAAVLTESSPDTASYAGQVRTGVRWTGRDGVVRTGRARVDTGLKSGTRVSVWTDDRGALAPAPLKPDTARAEAVLIAATVAGGICAVVLGAGVLAGDRLDRRREEQWQIEWARIGPRWDHRTA